MTRHETLHAGILPLLEDAFVNRFLVLAVCLGSFSLGCGGNTEKDKNPNPALGEINTAPLPKRSEKGILKTPGKGK